MLQTIIESRYGSFTSQVLTQQVRKSLLFYKMPGMGRVMCFVEMVRNEGAGPVSTFRVQIVLDRHGENGDEVMDGVMRAC